MFAYVRKLLGRANGSTRRLLYNDLGWERTDGADATRRAEGHKKNHESAGRQPALQSTEVSRYDGSFSFASLASQRSNEKKKVRVTWRQCNTRDTVGEAMCKHRGLLPECKNRNNHDWSP